MPTAIRRESQRLADQLERSFRGGAWHGPALAEVLDGIDESTARRSSPTSTHSIAELVWHVCFWIRSATARIADSELPDGQDWPDQPPSWAELKQRLDRAESDLLQALRALDDERLDQPAGSDASIRGLLLGILQHNSYHAGQISLLRRESTP